MQPIVVSFRNMSSSLTLQRIPPFRFHDHYYIPRSYIVHRSFSASVTSPSVHTSYSSSVLPFLDPTVFQRYLTLCTRIENILHQDIGKRNICSLIIPGDLAKAGIAFLLSKRIGILTGFPCRISSVPPTETDGPTGALYLAYGALQLGKYAGIITDESSRTVMEQLVYHRNNYKYSNTNPIDTTTTNLSSTLSASFTSSILSRSSLSLPSSSSIFLDTFPAANHWDLQHKELLQKLIRTYDHTIAIERSGRSATLPGTLVLPEDPWSTTVTSSSLSSSSSSSSSLAELYHRTKNNPSLYSYRTMKGKDMSNLVAPIDELLIEGTEIYDQLLTIDPVLLNRKEKDGSNQIESSALSTVSLPTENTTIPVPFHSLLNRQYARISTGIGDGGNECGMGKVYKKVQTTIPYGRLIASIIPTDNLLTCGVSHWGNYGLLAAVEALLRYNIFPVSFIHSFTSSSFRNPFSSSSSFSLSLLPSPEEEIYFTRIMNKYGAADGINNSFEGMIDGLPLSVHIDILEQIRTLLRQEFVN